jgi:selenocysteine lyase/cysteine desulfurase
VVSPGTIAIENESLEIQLRDFLEDDAAAATHDFFERLRTDEYERLDRHGHVYLDYTGGGLYSTSQLNQITDQLKGGIFGNPHSVNPTSLASTELVDETRRAILEFFRADPDEYDAIFTANASAALKLVGESFPFAPGSRFALAFDNHNSVNGIREFARARGATVEYIPLTLPELRLDSGRAAAVLQRIEPGFPALFAFPAQSNFSGVQHRLELIQAAQSLGWRVLLDAAAFVPTNRLDLRRHHPDFVSISFYKMFGIPTGVGCLIARKEALQELQRPWFAGGTISLVSVQGEGWHRLLSGAAGFEDGTLSYLSLPGVRIGLQYLGRLNTDKLHKRVEALSAWLLNQMGELRHLNGAPMVQIYGPLTMESRGGTVAFNLRDPAGELLHFRNVESLAARNLISLRTGCFCNPGAGETAHHITGDDMRQFFTRDREYSFDEFFDTLTQRGKRPSTVRVSVGIATSFADLHRFVAFLRSFLDQPANAAAAAAGRRGQTGPRSDTA